MPIFTIETPSGKRIKIEAPDEATAMRGAQEYEAGLSQSQKQPSHPEFDPANVPGGVPGYNPETGMVERTGTSDKVGAFLTGAADIPILGPAIKSGSAAAAAALTAPFSDDSFGDLYSRNRATQERVMRDNPGTALAGNIAGSMAVMAPISGTATGARLFGMGSGPLLGRMGMSAGTSASISAADTAARGGSGSEILGSAAVGGALGGAIPAAGDLLKGGYGAVRDRVGGMMRGAISPELEAARRVGSSIRIDRASPAGVLGPDDLAAAARNQQPLINADLGGEQTRALARAAANQSPEARGALERATSDRFADQGNRVTRMISRLTGGKTDDLLMIDGIRDLADAANNPAYKRAFATPQAQAMWNEGYEQLMQAPAMQKAARMAVTRGANRSAVQGFQPIKNPFTEVNGRLVLRRNPDGSVAKPTLQFWDQVKKNLDSDIGKAIRAGDKPLSADLTALKKTLVGMLDDTVPSYKSARMGAASFFGAEDAVDAGRKFAKSTRMLPEFKRGIAALKPAEREAFETGFASELIDMAKSVNDRSNVVTRMFQSPEAREKMVLAFGPQRAREIEAFVRVENAMDALRGAFGNSTTARQLIEAGVIGGGTWWYTGDFNKGIFAAALTGAGRAAGKKIDGNVMTKTAELLLSNDPAKIQRAVQLASMSPKHMAAVDALMKAGGLAARSGAVATPALLANQ